MSAKFWLAPVRLARNLGFKPHELRMLESMISNHADSLMEEWHGFFGS